MNTHVCLVSDQLVPNVLPALKERPDRVVLLVSDDKREQGKILEKIFRDRGMKTLVEKIPPYDMEAALEVCGRVVEQCGADGELTLNVTGGTKPAALAAYQQFFFASRRIIYMDTTNDRILELGDHPGRIPLTENLLKVGECLACHGKRIAPPRAERRDAETAWKERRDTERLCRLLLRKPEMLRALNAEAAKFDKTQPPFVLDWAASPELDDELAGLLESAGLAARERDGSMRVASEANRAYLNGGWLEEYVYNSIRGMALPGLDCRLNVHIEWRDPDAGTRPKTTNEHDVLFTHKNRLHMVSCKTSGLDRSSELFPKGKEAVYELDSLGRSMGGAFAQAMLVSAHRLRPEDRQRAKQLGITVFQGNDLLNLAGRLAKLLDPPGT